MDYSFDVEIAMKYGVKEAIIIRMFQFWIIKNKANNRHYYDGRTWTYNSIPALQKLFPFWSGPQIKRIIKKLEQKKVIMKANYNSSQYDRTAWYAFVDETEYLSEVAPAVGKNRLFDETKSSHQKNGFVPPIPVNIPFKEINNPPIIPPKRGGGHGGVNYPPDFLAFWAAYPRKVAKGTAYRAWAKLKPDPSLLKAILKAIEKQKRTEQWQRDGGQYIPYPATWLNARRWEDEVQEIPPEDDF